MKAKLSQLENILESTLTGPDISFEGISIDSRTTIRGNLFIALHGDKYDGHDYINKAIKNGAVAVITEKDISSIPHIKVNDTMQSLTMLSSQYLKQINPTTISITGTNGKTTVTSMTAHIVGNYKNTLSIQ